MTFRALSDPSILTPQSGLRSQESQVSVLAALHHFTSGEGSALLLSLSLLVNSYLHNICKDLCEDNLDMYLNIFTTSHGKKTAVICESKEIIILKSSLAWAWRAKSRNSLNIVIADVRASHMLLLV